MLAFLGVKGFAIIDELRVEFGEGFNVITGETGAGKSIIINALSALMNMKMPGDVVRTNAAQAEITGHFFRGEEEYLVKRVIGKTGRSKAFVNDDPVISSRLEEVGSKSISIYGQNEFQHLLNKENYTFIVDRLLLLEKDQLLLKEKVDALRKADFELEKKVKEAEGKTKETELLEFQIEEIERHNIREGEEESVRERLKTLKNAEKIHACLAEISNGLYEGESSVQGMFKGYMGMLRSFSTFEAMEELRKKIEMLSFDVEDILLEIRNIEKGLLFDPEELQILEDRLSDIYRLKEKYGKTCDTIRKYSESAKERLEYLRSLSSDIDGLQKQKAVLIKEVEELAEKLSVKRKKGSVKLERSIIDELGFLSMKGLQFKIHITDKGFTESDGKDDIELLISANPGEPLKPLRKIASGGELSRIMLAIKKVVGGEEEKTLIFDEVDSGIGGKVADMVGKRLKDLAGRQQVICITHLPQIAAYADHHFLVEKYYEHGTTRTGIRELSKKERVEELARMMGGEGITKKTIERAEEMIGND